VCAGHQDNKHSTLGTTRRGGKACRQLHSRSQKAVSVEMSPTRHACFGSVRENLKLTGTKRRMARASVAPARSTSTEERLRSCRCDGQVTQEVHHLEACRKKQHSHHPPQTPPCKSKQRMTEGMDRRRRLKEIAATNIKIIRNKLKNKNASLSRSAAAELLAKTNADARADRRPHEANICRRGTYPRISARDRAAAREAKT